MVQVSESERELIDDLLECIAEAMSNVDSVDTAYANKTKLQKLLYLSIDEFDLPITYSWYLAGAVLPGDPATPQALKSAFDRVESPEEPSISTSTEPERDDPPQENGTETDPDETIEPILSSMISSSDIDSSNETNTISSIDGHPRHNIVDFYTSELPDVWHQNTMRFLQNFYLEHAPEEYRDLYVQSTHLRIRLHDIEAAVEAHVKGDSPAQPIEEQVREVGLDISDLHMTIRKSEELSPTFETFVEGTNIIEDGLMMLAQKSPTELTDDHLEAIKSIQDFYYYYVWRYPCLIISSKTVTGPSAEILREERQEQLSDFKKRVSTELDNLKATLDDVGLQPSYTDYPHADDEIGNTVADLASHYFDQ